MEKFEGFQPNLTPTLKTNIVLNVISDIVSLIHVELSSESEIGWRHIKVGMKAHFLN